MYIVAWLPSLILEGNWKQILLYHIKHMKVDTKTQKAIQQQVTKIHKLQGKIPWETHPFYYLLVQKVN